MSGIIRNFLVIGARGSSQAGKDGNPLVVAFCFFLIVDLAMVLCAWDQYRLEKDGMVTEGKAFRVEYRQGKGGYYYDVRYIFQYNHAAYVSDTAVDEAWVKANPVPRPIRVQFLADDPSRSWTPEVGNRHLLRQSAIVITICTLVATVLGMKLRFRLRDYLRERKSGGFDLRALRLPAYPKGWH